MAARQGARKWITSLFGSGNGAAVSEAAASASAAGSASSSKSVAKERLQIILAHQRGSLVLAGVDMQALQKELLECVQRHIRVANGAHINIAVKNEGQLDIFEMQVPVDGGNPSYSKPTGSATPPPPPPPPSR